ncbi:MAG: Nif3-like dinuclear metal center hexameric protein [Planctomycetes bacterium]|nr:Nif3-like dinuclear metal center hexameric protein [Planctomycetota bacterium]
MQLADLVQYLDDYLRIAEIPDYPGAENGLQIEGRSTVCRIAAAVDACRATIDEAVRLKSDLLIVHHGLLWGGAQRWTGPLYRKLLPAFEGRLGVYSCHLPLDAHPEVGNNHQLARALGLHIAGPFGLYQNCPIGVRCTADLARQELMERLDAVLGSPSRLLPCGPLRVRQVGILTGNAGNKVAEASSSGLDTLITGEGPHQTFLAAEDASVNVFLSGHYATETFGVRALARHLHARFGLDWEFIDHPSSL